jgi:hypothetical protein
MEIPDIMSLQTMLSKKLATQHLLQHMSKYLPWIS